MSDAELVLRASIVAYLRSSGSEATAAALSAQWGLPSSAQGVDLSALVSAHIAAHPPSASPAPAAAMSAELEKKFESYKKLLETRGYFKDVAENTPAYAERLEKARGHFLAKYAQDSAAQAASEKKEETLSPEERTKRAEAHKEKGNELLQAKRYADAIAEYSAAIGLNANSAVYHANRALALQRVGRHEDAVRDCRASLALDAKYVKAAVRLSHSLSELRRPDEARSALNEALAVSPGNADLLKALEALKPASAPVAGNPWANMFRGQGGAQGGGADGMGMDEGMPAMPPGMPNMPMPPMGANGMPNFMEMMSNPQFVQMAQQMVQNNPELMRVAEQMMRDPQLLANMFQNMPGGMGGAAFGGAGMPVPDDAPALPRDPKSEQ